MGARGWCGRRKVWEDAAEEVKVAEADEDYL